jgi:hypothetical protein
MIGNSVTYIGDNAFYNIDLRRVTIPANVQVGSDPFGYGFSDFYNSNGKKAGTYEHSSSWSIEWWIR